MPFSSAACSPLLFDSWEIISHQAGFMAMQCLIKSSPMGRKQRARRGAHPSFIAIDVALWWIFFIRLQEKAYVLKKYNNWQQAQLRSRHSSTGHVPLVVEIVAFTTGCLQVAMTTIWVLMGVKIKCLGLACAGLCKRQHHSAYLR